MIRKLIALGLLLSPLSAFGWTFGNDGGGTWAYRIPITVPAAAVDANLTNVPVYLDASDLPADFHTNVAANGCDIRFGASDGTTELAGELVSYDSVGDTGEFYFLAPSLDSAADTVFYIYYGNASATCYVATDTYGSQAVWADYHFVAHDGGDTDSTGNVTATVIGTPLPTIGAATGIVGDATQYNVGGGVKQGITLPDPPVHLSGFYVSAFVNYSSVAGADFMYLWQHGDSVTSGQDYYRPYESEASDATYPRYRALIRDSGDNFGDIADDFATTRIPPTGTWQHFTMYGAVGGNRGAHLNGTSLGTPTTFPAGFNPTGVFVLAAGADTPTGITDDRETAGIFDEFRLRLATPANVDAWASFEYDNISSPATTYSIGVQETPTGNAVADFSADVTLGRPSLTVQFTDLSSDGGSAITAWSWDVNNDGTPDYTTQNPSHTYTAEGVYTVSLTVTNANGSDTETKVDYIEVVDNWWLDCGDQASLVGVYDPWQVAVDGGSLASSYTDLSGAGNDLTVAAGTPALGSVGWVFNGTQSLSTGVVLNPATTTIAAYGTVTSADNGRMVGVYHGGDGRHYLIPDSGSNGRTYGYGSVNQTIAGGLLNTLSGMALAGNQPYLNGSADGAAITATLDPAINSIHIGSQTASDGSTATALFTGEVRRVVLSSIL